MDHEDKMFFASVALLIFLLIGVWIFFSNFDKITFNKFSNNEATSIDAMSFNLKLTAW